MGPKTAAALAPSQTAVFRPYPPATLPSVPGDGLRRPSAWAGGGGFCYTNRMNTIAHSMRSLRRALVLWIWAWRVMRQERRVAHGLVRGVRTLERLAGISDEHIERGQEHR